MNIEKYLDRIKHRGKSTPNLDLLKKLQKQHLLHVPFENLDIHYNVPIKLDIDRIYKKIVLNKRGGFCYELNGLFFKLLIALNFEARQISARVYNKEKGYGKEFDHMAIIVRIDDNEYLTDVGFGDFTFEPLKIDIGKIQYDERGTYLVDKYNDTYFSVNKTEKGKTTPKYIFQTSGRNFKEFQEMCAYHQTSPESNFTRNRLISLPTTNGRITISGNNLKINASDSTTEHEIKDEVEFKQYLRSLFDIPKL
ncbi:N-hydroxyarylamine O-acetyltransferase [Saccharicrinis carchari]|uniref:N-hydroxyarylamine O-acetyltransferase n=1 Tax=Saccharicrinis carchari TaxID=1168039 RepID=A0A521CJ65_SACCC|nr:arylamine N-acetyltransferase [Saccharicrinis carchari]SMO59497.1 N-hydroxyarylamine O-acetyltransferase [Saccharicrinis carchari]